jgi:hypothetical protein
MTTKAKEFHCKVCRKEWYAGNTDCSGCGAKDSVVRFLAPIGIVPKKIWVLKRIEDLQAAILRYLEADWPVPVEWYHELDDHIRGLQREQGLRNERLRKTLSPQSESIDV